MMNQPWLPKRKGGGRNVGMSIIITVIALYKSNVGLAQFVKFEENKARRKSGTRISLQESSANTGVSFHQT